MYSILFQIHKISVLIFLLIYVAKLALLLSGKKEMLTKLTSVIKVPEMVVSFSFLASGIYLVTQYPFFGSFMIIKLAAVVISIPLAVVGFKKQHKFLATLSVALILTAYGIAEMNKKFAVKKNLDSLETGSVSSESVVNGQALFEKGCTPCHGADGKAGIAGAADLSASVMEGKDLELIIKKGKGSMPGFNYLDEKQLVALEEYVKTLRKP